MKPYTVTWLPSAEDQLAECWLAATNKEEIRSAADSLETALSRLPHNLGEERSPGQRIAQVGPLVVLFEVREEDRRVTVLRVKLRS